MFEDLDLSQVQDENARTLIARLLNLVEKLSANLREAQAEIHHPRDEVNRRKGRERHKSSKKANIVIDREQVNEP